MVFWIDEKGKTYWRKEIDNAKLLKIAQGLTAGKGNLRFLSNERIDDVFEECFNRGLMDSYNAHDKCLRAKVVYSHRLNAEE
jgi:hypothetical protein